MSVAVARDPTTLSVWFLDVGQGDATLVLPPGDAPAIVFDCRDDQVVDKTLRVFGVSRLAAVVFSHLDWDHIAGGMGLLEAWRGRVDDVFIDVDGRSIDGATEEAAQAKALVDYVTLPGAPWRVRRPDGGLTIGRCARRCDDLGVAAAGGPRQRGRWLGPPLVHPRLRRVGATEPPRPARGRPAVDVASRAPLRAAVPWGRVREARTDLRCV